MSEVNISDLESDISAILLQENAVLIDLSLKNLGGNPIIQVFADNEKGINANELAEINRKISKIIDEKEDFPKNYRLDISSPGVDRPLIYPWQYNRNIGRHLEVTFKDEDEQKTVTGTLESIDDQKILLQTSKQKLEITFPQIIKAIVQIRFK
jgi:ribosome maturation factor RimP